MGGGLVALPVGTPHFDIPFRFVGGSPAVVEQDTSEDITNCVEAILRTPQGFRVYDNRAEFGIEDPTFELQPVDIELMKNTVVAQEPRADVVFSENTSLVDSLVANIKVEVS
jgi:hypothetical protein